MNKTGATKPAVKKKLFFSLLIKRTALVTTMAFAALVCTIVFSVMLIIIFNDLSSARANNDRLRKMAEPAAMGEETAPYINAFDAEMKEINPDYFGWLKIGDTPIDYPVVHGGDNEKYLSVSFDNEKNIYGALFLDFCCKGDSAPHLLIHGYNAKTGDMFGSLTNFFDKGYLALRPRINLLVNGRMYEYEIFSVRKVNAYSSVYTVNFILPGDFSGYLAEIGAPADTEQILTLSTCASGEYTDERVIIQAALSSAY